jgi:hypothetical protein
MAARSSEQSTRNQPTSSTWSDGGETVQVRFGGVARIVLYPLAYAALTTTLMAVVLRYAELEGDIQNLLDVHDAQSG